MEFTHQLKETEVYCSDSRHNLVAARKAVGDTADGDQEGSNLAVEGELVVVHLGVRRPVVASVDMGTERVVQVGSCCSPLRQERGSRKELSNVARTSVH